MRNGASNMLSPLASKRCEQIFLRQLKIFFRVTLCELRSRCSMIACDGPVVRGFVTMHSWGLKGVSGFEISQLVPPKGPKSFHSMFQL